MSTVWPRFFARQKFHEAQVPYVITQDGKITHIVNDSRWQNVFSGNTI